MRFPRVLLLSALFAALPTTLIACGGDDDDDDNTPNTGGTSGSGGGDTGGTSGSGGGDTGGASGAGSGGTGGGGTTCDLSGEGKERVAIETPITGAVTLTADTVWTLSGTVEVQAGGVLTIEPCTRIEGTQEPVGVLMVERGAQIQAAGTADEPILFTSDQPAGSRAAGQWGGIVLLGNADIAGEGANLKGFEGTASNDNFRYGGDNDADDSGTLQYLRIEYGGYTYLEDREVNGLSMAGIGSGTTIDHIMVSNTLDDCFEFWGGTVQANYLICNNAGDDMFDADDGFRGGGSNWFGRVTKVESISSDDPNGLEWDSILAGDQPATNVTAEDVTLCGVGQAGVATNPNYGMVLRELVTGSITGLTLTGFEFGVDARDSFVTGETPNVTIANSTFIGVPVANVAETDNDMDFDEAAWFTGGTGNTAAETGDFTLEECLAAEGPAASVGIDWATGLWVDWSEN